MKCTRWVVMVLGIAAASATVAFIPLVNAAQVGKMGLVESLKYWNQGDVKQCTAVMKFTTRHCRRIKNRSRCETEEKSLAIRCSDSTVSFEQPDGSQYVNWGACVPTAIANLFCMQCRMCELPSEWLGLTGLESGGGVLTRRDLAPALRKEPLKRENAKLRFDMGFYCRGFGALWKFQNALSSKGAKSLLEWLSYSTKIKPFQWETDNITKQNFLHSNSIFNPVLIELNDYTGKSGHLTTVVGVDVDNKIVVHNTWGRQYRTRWKGFHELWEHGGFGALILGEPDGMYKKYKERLDNLSWYDSQCTRPPNPRWGPLLVEANKRLCKRIETDFER